MRQFNLLFGFAQEKTEETIIRSLNAMGLAVMATKKTKKGEIMSYLKENPDTDAVILKEYLDGGGELGAQDLIELSDDNSVNFVIVLDAKHRGRDEMKDIYAAGILNACFSDNKYGVNADELAKLSVRSRTHREAREYYRIDQARANHRFLSYTEFKELYSFLLDEREGLNISDRFITLSRWIDEEQLGSFLKMLPKETKTELSQYKEFVEVNNRLFKLRYVDDKYSVNSKTKDGLDRKEIANKMLEESGKCTMGLPEPRALETEENTGEVKDSEEVKGDVSEGDDLRSMAMKAREEMENTPKAEDGIGAPEGGAQESADNKAESPLSRIRKKLLGNGSGNRPEKEVSEQAVDGAVEQAVDGAVTEEKSEPKGVEDTAVTDTESVDVATDSEEKESHDNGELEKAMRDNALVKEELSRFMERVDNYINEQNKKEKEQKVKEPLPTEKEPERTEPAKVKAEKPVEQHKADISVKKAENDEENAAVKRAGSGNDKGSENEDKKPSENRGSVSEEVKKSVPVDKPSERKNAINNNAVKGDKGSLNGSGNKAMEKPKDASNKETVPGKGKPVTKEGSAVNGKPVDKDSPAVMDKPVKKDAPSDKDRGQRDKGKAPNKKKSSPEQIKGQLTFDDILNQWA